MHGTPPTRPSWTSVLRSTVTGALFGYGTAVAVETGVEGHVDPGHLAASTVFGALQGLFYGLSSGQTVGEKLKHCLSLTFNAMAAFTGSFLGLGIAGGMQAAFSKTVVDMVEDYLGHKLDPKDSEQVFSLANTLYGVANGFAWWTLSPTVGVVAGTVGTAFNGLRTAINGICNKCGKEPLLLVPDHPGETMISNDFSALGFGVGIGAKSGWSTYKALIAEGKPVTTLAVFAPDPTSGLLSGMCGVSGVVICTLLVSMRDGGWKGKVPPSISGKQVLDTYVSRTVAMARSGFVDIGPFWGPTTWAMRQTLASPGGIMHALKASPKLIGVVNAAMTMMIIGPMANEWFTQLRRNGAGAPGQRMDGQLKMVKDDGRMEVLEDRMTAELWEAMQEVEGGNIDGDSTLVDVLRQCLEGVGAAFHTGLMIEALSNHGDPASHRPEQFSVPPNSLSELLQASSGTVGLSVGIGAATQYLLMQGLNYASVKMGRSDPQSERAISSMVGEGVGGVTGTLTYCNVLGFQSVPGVAVGSGAAILLDRFVKGCKPGPGSSLPEGVKRNWPSRGSYPPVDLKGLELNTQGLRQFGRGRKLGQSEMRFFFEKFGEHFVTAAKGPRQGVLPPQDEDVPVVAPVDDGGGLGVDEEQGGLQAIPLGNLPPDNLQLNQPINMQPPPQPVDEEVAEEDDPLPNASPESSLHGIHMRVVGESLENVHEEENLALHPESQAFLTPQKDHKDVT